jgi:hypothetical protein
MKTIGLIRRRDPHFNVESLKVLPRYRTVVDIQHLSN